MKWTFAAGVSAPPRPQPATPFVLGRFGPRNRLAWDGEACEVRRDARLVGWADCALVIDPTGWLLIDRRVAGAKRIEGLAALAVVGVADGVLCATTGHGRVEIPLADLEALVPGKHEVELVATYPLRDPSVRVAAKVLVADSTRALVPVRTTRGTYEVMLDSKALGLASGTELVLGDELWPGEFAYAEVAGQPRRPASQASIPRSFSITCSPVARSADPALGITATVAPIAADHAPLLAEITADPDDDIARAILIDLLADRGEPAAATFALLRAGKKVGAGKRKAALGPLAHYFEIEFHRGLPWAATLVRTPPDDAPSLAALLGDLRLGLLARVRCHNGPLALYRHLLASRALGGLRHVEAPGHEELAILSDTLPGQLVELTGVRLANGLALAMLGDTAFSAVRHIELVAPRALTAAQAVGYAAALPALPLRRLSVVPQGPTFPLVLARRLIPRMRELELASLELAGVTLSRAGARIDVVGEGPVADLARAAAS